MVLRDREVEVWVKELFHIILHITGSPEVVEEERSKTMQVDAEVEEERSKRKMQVDAEVGEERSKRKMQVDVVVEEERSKMKMQVDEEEEDLDEDIEDGPFSPDHFYFFKRYFTQADAKKFMDKCEDACENALVSMFGDEDGEGEEEEDEDEGDDEDDEEDEEDVDIMDPETPWKDE